MASAGRVLIIPKGAYRETEIYEMLDLVFHNGESWLAKTTAQGIEPCSANEKYWHKMTEKPGYEAYEGAEDIDESNLGNWLNGLMETMSEQSTINIRFKCPLAIGNATYYGTLCKQDALNATVMASACIDDGKGVLHKVKVNGTWVNAKFLAYA